MNNTQPILSICVPTYNRRFQLESLVNSIVAQPEFASGRVELSISDNASTDGTKEYLVAIQKQYSLLVNINDTNLGYMPNFKKAIERSTGKFVWLLGSDDLLCDRCLEGLINALESNSQCDYFMVNNMYWFGDENPTQIYHFNKIENKQNRVEDLSHHLVERIAELISKRSDAFTPMYSSIMLKMHWMKAFEISEPMKHNFETINNCSFIAVYIAKNLFSKPGYYYGTPAVLASHTIGWEDYRAVFTVSRLADLYDLWIKNGADKAKVNQYKKEYFGPYHKHMVISLLRKETNGYSYFSFAKYLKQYFGIYNTIDLFDIIKGCIFKEGVDYKLKIRIFLSKIKKTILLKN